MTALRARTRAPLGFTLIELVVTLALLGVMAMLAAPLAELAVKRSKEQELRNDLREIRTALDRYKQASDLGQIPKNLGESGYPPSLAALVDGVPNARDPNGRKIYFLRRIPRDPFAKDESVSPADTWGKRSYDSPPTDPREGADVYDVYSRSDQVGLNGIAYKDW